MKERQWYWEKNKLFGYANTLFNNHKMIEWGRLITSKERDEVYFEQTQFSGIIMIPESLCYEIVRKIKEIKEKKK